MNNVVGVMKLFFRDLPVPLFTRDPDRLFMKAAGKSAYHPYRIMLMNLAIEEYTARRDRLHELINDLPDPNYATLRALTLVRSPPHHVRVVFADCSQASLSSTRTQRCQSDEQFQPQQDSRVRYSHAPYVQAIVLTDRCISPTFLGSDSDLGVADADWQKIVLNTILENTLQIFDDD